MTRIRRLPTFALALATFVGAGSLLARPATADSTTVSFRCENEACWGSRTCEYHGGTQCDLNGGSGTCETCDCAGSETCGGAVE